MARKRTWEVDYHGPDSFRDPDEFGTKRQAMSAMKQAHRAGETDYSWITRREGDSDAAGNRWVYSSGNAQVKGQERNFPVGDRSAQRHRKVLHATDVANHGYCKACGETDDCLGPHEGDHFDKPSLERW